MAPHPSLPSVQLWMSPELRIVSKLRLGGVEEFSGHQYVSM